MPAEACERHDLVWLAPGAAGRVRVAEPARARDVERWLADGRPAVVARRPEDLGREDLALGIALPAARGRARLALLAPRAAVARVARPLRLAEALASAPAAWRGPLAALDDEARRAGITLRVFGSLAWQRLTGEAYLREGSDVDLLVPGADGEQRARALALLSRWAGRVEPRLDGELLLGGGRAVAWREVLARPARILVKTAGAPRLEPLEGLALPPLRPAAETARVRGARDPREIGRAALAALREELATDPKPGLVTPRDPGAHADMDAATFAASLSALDGFFADAAAAGLAGAPFADLRALGLEAEARMLRATGGVNTHRGAIFALGLLAAAAGRLAREGRPCEEATLGETVRETWGRELRALAPAAGSHGAAAARAYGAGGAREEAARGFPHVLGVGLPALEASLRRGASPRAARVQCLLALVARLPDTNLLHRGGPAGLALARGAARGFLAAGGVHRRGWQGHAARIHRVLVARNLSPGGSADLLAATLLVRRLAGGEATP